MADDDAVGWSASVEGHRVYQDQNLVPAENGREPPSRSSNQQLHFQPARNHPFHATDTTIEARSPISSLTWTSSADAKGWSREI